MVWLLLSAAMGLVSSVCAYKIVVVATARIEMREIRRMKRGKRFLPEASIDMTGHLGAFVRSVLAEPSLAGRVDLLAERVAQVHAETWSIPVRIRMWARVALFSGGGLSLGALSDAIRRGQSHQIALSVLPFCLGVVVAIGCYWMGRMAGIEVESRRQAWDALSDALVRPLLPEPSNFSSGIVGGTSLQPTHGTRQRPSQRRRQV